MGTDVDSDERRLTAQINSRKIVELGAHFQEKFYAKVSDIGAYINEKIVIGYTISGLTKWLYPHDFRYKHIKPVHAKLNPEEQQTFDVVNRFVETFNTETALDFFEAPNAAYTSAKKIHVVLDQLGYHRSDAVK